MEQYPASANHTKSPALVVTTIDYNIHYTLEYEHFRKANTVLTFCVFLDPEQKWS